MNEFLWVETYRPKIVADTILPDRIKTQFQAYVDAKNLPNLILSGGPGCGKTTVAKAILDELGCDYMVINGSLNGNIDMLRNEILQFASTVSFNGGRKFVILDEADYLTAATQAALRNFMEEYSKNCGFILTANFRHKIIDALHSRCSLIEFKFRKDEGLELKKSQIKRLATILKKEEIEFDVKALAEVVTKYYPDFRRTINEVQAYSVSGKIDSGILANFDEAALKTLVGFLKDKDFTSARAWAHENTISDDEVFTKLYENSANIVQPSSVPILVKILSDAMYQSAFMSNREINMAAAFVDIMQHVEFK